jgi:1,2-dihydroxy-3-keto-5-methylthiopentene dioxygenase
MAILKIPETQTEISNAEEIKIFLKNRAIGFEQWRANVSFEPDADPESIIDAYQPALGAFMQERGYAAADVVSIHPGLPNLKELHEKFFKEHTHTEDEVRFFVEGCGYFWFHLSEEEPVFCVLCQAGDLIAVPAGVRHWFDMGPNPYAKVIRMFTDPVGWTPYYTHSSIENSYSF